MSDHVDKETKGGKKAVEKEGEKNTNRGSISAWGQGSVFTTGLDSEGSGKEAVLLLLPVLLAFQEPQSLASVFHITAMNLRPTKGRP